VEKPGEFPFTRGIYSGMYRDRLWTMRQYAGFGTAEESNARYRYLLSQGTTGLSVAFDLPTQMGMDPDHPLAAGEVGRVGVSIASLADMRKLFDGHLAGTGLHVDDDQLDGGDSARLSTSCREGAGRRPPPISGTIQNDILKEYIARGTYIYPAAGRLCAS
jgi:methylmalonyl-CoA mutase N-terminal domain/subunit